MVALFIVPQEGAALSKLVDDLLLLDDRSDTQEWTLLRTSEFDRGCVKTIVRERIRARLFR